MILAIQSTWRARDDRRLPTVGHSHERKDVRGASFDGEGEAKWDGMEV